MFYLKLTLGHLKTSLKTFLPFIWTSLLLYVLICSNLLISASSISQNMKYGARSLTLALVVLTLFALVMEIYSYLFLLKQRSKGLGLYHLLGMNKRQIYGLVTLELAVLLLIILIAGSFLSAVFANLFYLLFVRIVGYQDLNFSLTSSAFLDASLIFLGIFTILEIIGLSRIKCLSPLIFFQHHQQGEKEPRGNIFLAVGSLLCLVVGYYLSITANKIAALGLLMRFFWAVVLVIIGTYLFYLSFIAWYLKQCQKKKSYFYQPKHFIIISQMIFRMKKHALGLANITLFAIMAFVSIGTTTILYQGQKELAQKIFLKNTKINLYAEQFTSREEAQAYLADLLRPINKQVSDGIFYQTTLTAVNLPKNSHWSLTQESIANPNPNQIGFIYLTTQEDLVNLGNPSLPLTSQQVALYFTTHQQAVKQVSLPEQNVLQVQKLKDIKFPDMVNTYNSGVLVVNNQESLQNLKQLFAKQKGTPNSDTYSFFINLSKKESQVVAKQLEANKGNLSTQADFRQSSLELSGGFLFTGYLLGVSFLLGAALIIYYKQYTEGLEDRRNYHILQEVGMSQQHIRQSINTQIYLVFFMPLGMAIFHYLFALPIIKQLMLSFGITDNRLIYWGSFWVITGIVAIYFVTYKLTSKTYYRLIER